jgi:hypothetical protein
MPEALPSYALRLAFERTRLYLSAIIPLEKGLVLEQREVALREATGEQRNAFSDNPSHDAVL